MRSNPVGKAVRAVWNMKQTLPLTVNLMRDSRVARWNKLVFLFVTIGYLLFPYDFIFDFPIFWTAGRFGYFIVYAELVYHPHAQCHFGGIRLE